MGGGASEGRGETETLLLPATAAEASESEARLFFLSKKTTALLEKGTALSQRRLLHRCLSAAAAAESPKQTSLGSSPSRLGLDCLCLLERQGLHEHS